MKERIPYLEDCVMVDRSAITLMKFRPKLLGYRFLHQGLIDRLLGRPMVELPCICERPQIVYFVHGGHRMEEISLHWTEDHKARKIFEWMSATSHEDNAELRSIIEDMLAMHWGKTSGMSERSEIVQRARQAVGADGEQRANDPGRYKDPT